MRILIGIFFGFCLTILLFILLANIASYMGPPFDIDKIDIVNIYEYRSAYEKKNKEISDDQPIYRMVGEEARSFFKEISPNFKFAEVSYYGKIYYIEIKVEDTYYSGKIYARRRTIEIDNYCGKLKGKSKEIIDVLYKNYEREAETKRILYDIGDTVRILENDNNMNLEDLIKKEYENSGLDINEKLFSLIKNSVLENRDEEYFKKYYREGAEEYFEKYYRKDAWGIPINADYTTNLTGLSESLSNSLSKYPIALWSSGPNGIDERCLGDDIPWSASREY